MSKLPSIRKTAKIGGLAAGAVLGLAGGIAALVSYRVTRPKRLWFDMVPAEGHEIEDVCFAGSEGYRLSGWFLPAARTRAPAVILCHGWHMSRMETRQVALDLNSAGWSVLLFDFRGCGQSEGKTSTVGYREVDDLLGALSYLRTRPEVDFGRVGVMGISLGAAVALMAAAKCDDIRAVVADSCFATLEQIVGQAFDALYRLPHFPFRYLSVRLTEFVVGVPAGTIRPVEAVRRMAPRPLFFIHGERDRMVPPHNSEELYAAARGERELWIVPGAEHTMARFVSPEEYTRRVQAFFKQHL